MSRESEAESLLKRWLAGHRFTGQDPFDDVRAATLEHFAWYGVAPLQSHRTKRGGNLVEHDPKCSWVDSAAGERLCVDGCPRANVEVAS